MKKETPQDIYKSKNPWYRFYNGAMDRCRPGRAYYGRVKCLMTLDDFKFLWFRDKAHLMKRPSIDRINDSGNYEISNCHFIEYEEHRKKARTRTVNLLKDWDESKTLEENAILLGKDYVAVVPLVKRYGLKYKLVKHRPYKSEKCLECDKKPVARNLCPNHYTKIWRKKMLEKSQSPMVKGVKNMEKYSLDQITMDREKLAKQLYGFDFKALTWKEGWMHKEKYLKRADAIIANQSQIIKAVV